MSTTPDQGGSDWEHEVSAALERLDANAKLLADYRTDAHDWAEPGELYNLAQLAYAAYGEKTGFKNYQGLPMPAFKDLADNTKQAWKAAVSVVVAKLNNKKAGPDDTD